MRSKQIDLSNYDTDKIRNSYLDRYDSIFSPWIDKKLTLLELGVYKGGSLQLWRDYFPRARIVGVDLKIPANRDLGDRISLFQGDQKDIKFLSDMSKKAAPKGFDIIIDDASHIGLSTRITFWHLFDNHLKPGGLYVIEDWGTGYWDDWIDGKSFRPRARLFAETWHRIQTKWRLFKRIPIKFSIRSHDYGMVGFIKELVDEQGAADLTRKTIRGRPGRQSKFESLLITPSIVFVHKVK